jgi:drug/metabolite transporter (DMT)-like permease
MHEVEHGVDPPIRLRHAHLTFVTKRSQYKSAHRRKKNQEPRDKRDCTHLATIEHKAIYTSTMMKNAFILYTAAACCLLLIFKKVQVEAFTTRTNTATLTRSPRFSSMAPSEQLFRLHSTTTKEENTTTAFTSDLSSQEEQMIMLNAIQTDLNADLQMFSPSSTESGNADGWLEPLAWRGVILVLCALWASNFAAAKLVMGEPGVDSSLYALARFGVAATALAPGAISAAKRANMDWETLKASLICGSWVAFGYLGQTLGLLTTTASKSCVICSMHCVFVAVIAELWRVQRSQGETKFDLSRLLPAAVAVLGVAIVELKGSGGAPNIGDALSFAQPIGFGMGYLQLEELMSKKPEAALPVSALKLLVVATASLFMFELSPLVYGASDFALRVPDFGPILSSPLALGGIIYTGLVTTAFALWVESAAFAKVTATDASIILTTEPLFAAGFGAMALGETFGTSDYVGAALIVGACALAVLLGAPDHHETVKSGQGL